MGMVNRRKRRRMENVESLAGAWDRGCPPPEWAYQPGGHFDELMELVYFGTDASPYATKHPHYLDWSEAMREARA
ncbi:MAG TPA: hypothetical protein VM619_10720 [Luteimonas sp.]|nr:hypothetical protein [Luteimonas sp.]